MNFSKNEAGEKLSGKLRNDPKDWGREDSLGNPLLEAKNYRKNKREWERVLKKIIWEYYLEKFKFILRGGESMF